MQKIFLFAGVILLSCGSKDQFQPEDGMSSLSQSGFEQHVQRLASDEFEGRKPFTNGERKTIAYLEEQFKLIGLTPGNGDGFVQGVPMVEITTTADSSLTISDGKKSFKLRGFHDYTLNTERTDSVIHWKDEEIVFAGFGVVAPEYNWNDYEGLDVKGKIVLVLVNDPGFGGTDTTFFKGNTMTYYGRWTYKYEEAARQGAKGCFVIHNDVPAGYPFAVLQNNWNSAHLYLDQRGKDANYCEGIGWLTMPATERLFSAAGLDFKSLQTRARQRGFKGQLLNLKMATAMKVTTRYDRSSNVIGKIEGTDLKDEYVILTAHWDHLGIGKPDVAGDSIYNGAHDNASGTAGLLEIAKAFKSLENHPRRTILFLAVTAEEQGLWGSAYYAQNPIYPKEKTVANINMDGINPYGKMRDIQVIGTGQSEVEDILRAEAKALGRVVTPESFPERGAYFRSDHFSFARIGIPALYLATGSDLHGDGAEKGNQLKDIFTQHHYHKPSDEFKPDRINFDGAVDDLKLIFQVGKRLAYTEDWPKWKPGSEFKATRESYLK